MASAQAVTQQRYIPKLIEAPISNSRGAHSRSILQAPPRRGRHNRSVVVVAPPKTFSNLTGRAAALAAKIEAADASALALLRPDPSVWPSSFRSAYGMRSTVPAPAPRHRLSNKRACCVRDEKSWLSIHDRPSVFIQRPHGVRGFNARSTVATPGVTRGQQIRSFAETPRLWYGKVVEADLAGASDAINDDVSPKTRMQFQMEKYLMVRQAGRGPAGCRTTVVAPGVAGDDDRATRTFGRVHADRSTIAEQTRAFSQRSFISPIKAHSDIWEQEHAAVAQEWEKLMDFIAQEYEHVELAVADGVAEPVVLPMSPPPARKQEEKSVTLLRSSSTYPVRWPKVSAASLAPKARFWECCECMNRNYLFRDECGRCEFPRQESVRISTPNPIRVD